MSKKKYFTEEERKLANKEYQRKHRKNHIDEIKKADEKRRRTKGILPRKKYFTEEERKLAEKEYGINYRRTHKEETKKWVENHKKERKIHRDKYWKKKLKTDINFKLASNLRRRLHNALQNNQKVGSAVKDLGCSVSELRLYLESKFKEGMSWDNWGRTGWHIDHIKPLSSFNLQNKDDFLKANHYTNLQPLWAEENIKKGNK